MVVARMVMDMAASRNANGLPGYPTNQPVNERFNTEGLAIVDITFHLPFYGINIPRNRFLIGTGWNPFIGQVDITQMGCFPLRRLCHTFLELPQSRRNGGFYVFFNEPIQRRWQRSMEEKHREFPAKETDVCGFYR